ALKQNMTTLHNRVNELGVSEPVIQQQGTDRIVVQLAGVQDVARVEQILGRIATLEVRMVDESAEGQAAELSGGDVPAESERFFDKDKRPIIVQRTVLFTGENLTDAQAGFDQNQMPSVNLALDAKGADIFQQVTGENIGKRMAILLFEKGKGEVVTSPVIRDRISGGHVQITGGSMTAVEAADTALLLRAGSLAAPMEIIERRIIGPSLGEQNIASGFNSVKYGFLAVAFFMCVYYAMFGLFSTLALGFNLLMLVAVLSMMQATLTLPGMAAMALVLGMAIDANVLINERIREELRNGQGPQKAIAAGYERAWATIFDSNITTLIAGLALLAFGSGAIRGFAVVHCLGIVTSMFSAVFFSRALVNLWYGGKKKLQKLSIEFTGGTLVEAAYSQPANLEAIRGVVGGLGYKDIQVQNFGSSQDVLIRLPVKKGLSSAQQSQELLTQLKAQTPDVQIKRSEFVGPSVGDELFSNGLKALAFVIAGIVVYLAIRFEWKFAVAAIIANLHDVVIILGFFAFFQWEFSLSVLAAVLAVLGYSVNESV
ncbi:unnamed protein product, partial [Darwinula stevensoni]